MDMGMVPDPTARWDAGVPGRVRRNLSRLNEILCVSYAST